MPDNIDGIFAKSPTLAEGILGHRFSLTVVVLGVMMVAAMVLVLLVALQEGRREAVLAARASTANLARILADVAARTTDSVDMALSSVVALVNENGRTALTIAVARQISERLALTPALRQIVVTDGVGNVLFDTRGLLNGKVLPLAPYPPAEEMPRRPLMIGPLETRDFLGGPDGGGQTLLAMYRPMEGGDGRLAGMVIAAVDPQHFLTVADLLDLGDGKWVALYRLDGAPLAGGDGRSAAAETMSALRRQEEAGTRVAEMDDGVARLVSHRVTPGWPLVVEVGVSMDAVLVGWRQGATDLGLPVGAVVLAVLVLTAALARAVQRHYRDEAVMRLSDEVLRSIKSGVAIIDLAATDHPVVYINRAFENICGIDARQVLSRAMNVRPLEGRNGAGPVEGAAIPRDGLMLLRQVLAGNRPGEVVRRPFRRFQETVWCDTMYLLVENPKERSSHGVVVLHEVSEQVAAEQELLRSLDELATMHDEQSRFSEIFAHHLQEPVRRLVAHGQLLRRALAAPLPADAESALQVIDSSGRRLRHLLRDVELYISAGVSLRAAGRASVDDALREVLNREHRRLEAIQATVTHGPLPVVAVSREVLVEVLFALIDNGITYRAPDRHLHLSVDASRRGDEWVICVADNGIGIDVSYHDRVFRAFERLQADDAHPGTGIGLALARKLVDRAGGRIWVDSELGVGSRFWVALPAVDHGGVAVEEMSPPVGSRELSS